MHQTKNLYQNVQTHFSTFHLVTIFYELNACYFCHFKREREKKIIPNKKQSKTKIKIHI